MKMFELKFNVIPTKENEHYDLIERANLICLIQEILSENAFRKATFYINKLDWEIVHIKQYYFHSERGRFGLEQYRYDLCKLLWRLWSPTWQFDDATYERTATSFNNSDFVAVVIQSYRHRFGLTPGDPSVEDTERRLVAQPPITVPTIAIYGNDDGVMPVAGSAGYDRFFKAAYEHRVISGAGHNLPQEVPHDFSKAVLSLL